MINWNHPLTRGLIYAIPFTEKGGTNLFDQVKKLISTTSGTPSWKNTIFGIGMGFVSASSQYINTGFVINLGATDSLSFTCLTKISSSSPVGQTILFGSKDSTSNTPEFACAIGGTTNGAPAFFISGSGTGNTYANASSTDYRDNKWHLWTYIRDAGSTIKIYVDGNLVQSKADTTTGGINISARAAGFGAENSSGTFNQFLDMDGALVLLHNRTLTVSEIKQLYSNPWQIFVKPNINLKAITPAAGVAASFSTFKTLAGAGNI